MNTAIYFEQKIQIFVIFKVSEAAPAPIVRNKVAVECIRSYFGPRNQVAIFRFQTDRSLLGYTNV